MQNLHDFTSLQSNLMPQHAYCSNVVSAGWERFYPKGKGRRPNGKQGSGVFHSLGVQVVWQQWQHYMLLVTEPASRIGAAESSKSGDKDSSLGEVLQGGSLGQSLLFAAFVTLGLGLLNLSRSDSQVSALFQCQALHMQIWILHDNSMHILILHDNSMHIWILHDNSMQATW